MRSQMMQDHAVKQIDELLQALGDPVDLSRHSVGSIDLLLEHLRGARRYLLAAMPLEYELNLREAHGTLDCIGDNDLRDRTRRTIESLLDDHHHLAAA